MHRLFSAAGMFVFILLTQRLDAAAPEAPGQVPGRRIVLKEGWRLRSAFLMKADGAALSQPGATTEGWLPTSIPTTVLGALVKNGIYPDPRVGLNNFLIPDASDEFNQRQDLARYSYLPEKRNPWKDPYWFRTEFDLPKLDAGRRAWLHFDAINYRADVWLNGRQLADRRRLAGMFQRFVLDMTEAARPGKNALAVLVHPVDHPGMPSTQFEVFGRDRNYQTELMKDVTMVTCVGYDCMPTVRDRQMGLWQQVYVELTGPVAIRHPFVASELPLPDVSKATLAISGELVNASGERQEGVLRGRIAGTDVEFAQRVVLGPGKTKTVTISPKPVIEKPRLWWPVNYGPQNLYKLELEFCLDGVGFHAGGGLKAETDSRSAPSPRPSPGGRGGVCSDRKEVTFGVRQVTKTLHEHQGWHGLQLHVNGQKILCRGGYIQPEILFQWDQRRIETEIRYFTQANLNLIYFEDIPNPPEGFLEACDRYGLLFGNCYYSCFWVRPGTPHPEDLDLLSQCTVDITKRYRNHPALVLYMAMNEEVTREPVYTMWRRHILELDGTRLFIPSAYFPEDRKDVPPWIKPDTPVGMTDVGASYAWQEPEEYFRRVRGGRNWMFMMESGSASLPPIDSLRRFIPDLGERAAGVPFPLTKTWAEHGANHYYKPYDAALRQIHGEPASVADYSWKGHLVTADQHRAMFEAVNHRMWDVTSGFTQWKINACWPSVQWQIFDWYLRPMVSYYHIKRACEPLHVQLCPLDQMVTVVNHRLVPRRGMKVRAAVYDLRMKRRWEKTEALDVGANCYKDVFQIDLTKAGDLSPVYFVGLELADDTGRPLSDNFYWFSSKKPADLTPLAGLPMVKLVAESSVARQSEETTIRVKLANPTPRLAFFVHLALLRGPGGEEILPVFWQDNYFSLLPGEAREVMATVATRDVGSAAPTVEVGGWNVVTDCECEKLETAARDPKPGQAIAVTATVCNTALGGSRVELLVDGKPADSKWAWARGRDRDKLAFSVKFDTPGPHAIEVAGRRETIEVK